MVLVDNMLHSQETFVLHVVCGYVCAFISTHCYNTMDVAMIFFFYIPPPPPPPPPPSELARL